VNGYQYRIPTYTFEERPFASKAFLIASACTIKASLVPEKLPTDITFIDCNGKRANKEFLLQKNTTQHIMGKPKN